MAKILAVGGGSGGHVTPVVAVFRELQKTGDHELRFWCDKKFGASARGIFAKFDDTIPVELITAGKLRRYHGKSLSFHLHPSILLPNLRDGFKVVIGFFQSLFKLIAWRPDVIFIKGGYVCLPVGYAARLLRIPLVLHDSDAHPGLTNRLLSPFAKAIGTGAPLEYYNYPPEKASYVGIPVAPEFRPYSEAERQKLKAKLGFDISRPLVVVTGGGLGARRINSAILAIREDLLAEASVFLISGNLQYEEILKQADRRSGWRLQAFVHNGMAEVLAAADIVVTRAGATTLLELAALHKPTIIIPNGRLTGGHQLKNAKVYQDALAALIVSEDELDKDNQILARKIIGVLKSQKILKGLGDNFGKFAKPDAAKDMVKIILTTIRRQGRRR